MAKYTKPEVYQMKIKKPRRPEPIAIPKVEDLVEESDVPQPIQGVMPDSVEEYRFAQALDKVGYTYYYQYETLRYPFRGSQVVDFWVVNTVPYPTPVYIQGAYWHLGSKATESTYRIMELERVFRGRINIPVIVYDYEIPTLEDAVRIVRERLH